MVVQTLSKTQTSTVEHPILLRSQTASVHSFADNLLSKSSKETWGGRTSNGVASY